MIFYETALPGAYLIEPEPMEDPRGFFARSFCTEEFSAHGLDTECAQCNISYNIHRGTLRGMHYQKPPHLEAKLVRCTRGAIYDVVVDLRPDTETFGKYVGYQLNQENRTMLYIPRGFGHGFLTLTDHAEVFYQMSTPFVPDSAAGLRYNDPTLAISWPAPVTIVSDRDQSFPDFDPDTFQF